MGFSRRLVKCDQTPQNDRPFSPRPSVGEGQGEGAFSLSHGAVKQHEGLSGKYRYNLTVPGTKSLVLLLQQ